MSPLEGLAIGLVIVGTWLAGYFVGSDQVRRNTNALFDFGPLAIMPLVIGVLIIATAFGRIVILGVEASMK